MFRSLNKKIFHIIMIVIIVFVILCIAGILVLRYQVEGETNMPFEITKISIVEDVDGVNVDGTTQKRNIKVNQNNDIRIDISKNPRYGKTEIIEAVEINNIKVEKNNEKGEIKFYKPVTDEGKWFVNTPENEITSVTYKGELEENTKQLQITNQGGTIMFRYAINNISQYISETNEEINYSQLLKLTNVKEEDLQSKLSFDIIIKLISGKKYQATIELDFPTDGIIEKLDTQKMAIGKEIKELDDIIFKRIEN